MTKYFKRERVDWYYKDTPVNAIGIPDNATNGDMIKALFPCEDLEEDFDSEWWRSPYKRGDTE